MVACGLLAALGLFLAARWGNWEVRPPWAGEEPASPLGPGLVVRRYLWYLDLAVVAGIISGVLAAGAGGRLVMRLLAVTAGEAAQGKLTEAEEVVGEITVGGTLGFVIFAGLFSGLVTTALYLLLRRWLPGGRCGALAFGLLLLVVAATRTEPLRPDNPDFGIVGPGWVALVSFAALVLVHALLVAAVAGRLSRALPLLSRERRTWLAHAPLVLLVPAGSVFLLLMVVGGLAVALSRSGRVVAWSRTTAATTAGRVVLAAGALVALPGFVGAVTDIA